MVQLLWKNFGRREQAERILRCALRDRFGWAIMYNDWREWRSNMPVALPEPDGEREGIPLWLCPNCDQLKPLEDYGWKKRNDICPGQQVWFKQGWCNRCLEALIKGSEL
jgi:hypothetical protein